jgi:putative membrane protein
MLVQWGAHLAHHTLYMAALTLPTPTARLRVDSAPLSAPLLTRERLDTLVGVALALTGALYTLGLGRRWARGADDRWALLGRAAAFAGGLVTLLAALLSPLDALTTRLFTAHIAQYLLLADVAPPLLILGQPGATLRAALPAARATRLGAWWEGRPGARIAGELLTLPLVVAVLDVAPLLIWYQPRPFTAALTSGSLHLVEQLSILAAALLFWWTARHPDARPTLGHSRVLVSFFAASLASAAFGLALFLARTPWYPIYGDRAAPWNLTPLGDQQVGGIVLGVAPELLDLLAMLALLWGLIQAQERRATARARAERQARRQVRRDVGRGEE